MEHPDLSVVVPAYNEEYLLESTVRDIAEYLAGLGLAWEILVVDDGSRDRTRDIANNLAKDIPCVRVCSYEQNRGKGFAVRTGMLAAAGERVLFTDADHSTPISELPAMMSALDQGFGVAIGSRAVRGSVRTVRQPCYRELGGRMINLFIRLWAVPGIKDTQCGYKLFSRAAAQDVFARSTIEDFSFDIEALYLARKMGYRVAELPVHWANRSASRVRPFRDGMRIFADIFRIRRHRYKLPGARS